MDIGKNYRWCYIQHIEKKIVNLKLNITINSLNIRKKGPNIYKNSTGHSATILMMQNFIRLVTYIYKPFCAIPKSAL